MNRGLKKGWCGTILDINLTTGSINKRRLNKDDAKLFLGGRGLNSKTLFDRVPPAADPLGPENILCMAPGTLTATPLSLSSRLQVSTLSPYSGILGDGNAGGKFAYVMKRAGYDPDSGIPLPQTLKRLGIPEIGKRVNNDGPYSLWDGPPLWDLDTYPKSRQKR